MDDADRSWMYVITKIKVNESQKIAFANKASFAYALFTSSSTCAKALQFLQT